MLASQVKQGDREELVLQLEILSTALVAYERTQNPDLIPVIQDLNDYYETLKAKLETHDYTEDERKYNKITNDLDIAFGRKPLEAIKTLI